MSRRARLGVSSIGCLALLGLSAGADPASAGWKGAPLVPKLTGHAPAATLATLRRGARLGSRADVFAKAGDSLSSSGAFAQGLGCGRWNPGRYPRLRRTVRLFAARRLPGTSTYCDRVDSFSRDSAATSPGRISRWALEVGASADPSCGAQETPLACEIRLIRPAHAVILFGTNDVALALGLGGDPLPGFISSIRRMIATSRAQGVVPLLTTIPPRTDDPSAEAPVERLNAGLTQLARRRGVPLINLWRALYPLPAHGLDAKGLHLSVFGGPQCAGPCDPSTCAPLCEPANFTPAGLRYGYNVRNLATLLALARLSSLERSPRAEVRGHG
jgi:hypothetical protein